MRKKAQKNLAVQISDRLDLPRDLTMGDSIVTVTGRRDITVENYRGIMLYETALICLALKHGKIEIHGSELKIDYYTNDDMKISGRVDRIEYSL